MISEKYIMNLVREYAKTPKGKAEIKRKYGVDYMGDEIDRNELIKYGERMKEILFTHVNRLIRSIRIDDIVVDPPVIDTKGRYTMNIRFKDGVLHRESLYSEGYPDGLGNVVLLFARGYHARDYVYGSGESNSMRSKKDRAPNNFLYDAVSDFNTMAKGIAVAQLSDKYK